MKAIKIAVLAASAALLVTAFAGASTAFAGSTTLCVNNEQPCQEANRHPAGAFEAKSTKVTFTTSITSITCTESALSGETTAASGDPLPITFTGWSLAGCTTSGGTKCSTTPVGMPAAGSLNWAQGDTGLLAIGNGGSGAPGWSVKCGFLVNCGFTAEPVLDVSGKTIAASAEPMNTAGGFCPASVSLTGSYSITKPTGEVHVAPATAPTTVFCKSSGPICAATDRYASGSTIQASSSNVSINGTTAWPPMTCSSTLSATVGATSEASPLPVTVTGWTLSGCKTQGGTQCTTNTQGLPYPGSAKWIEGSNGALTINGQPAFQLICGFQINCKITLASGVEAGITGGAPAQLAVSGWKGNSSNGLCLGAVELSATYSVSSPSPLHVAHT